MQKVLGTTIFIRNKICGGKKIKKKTASATKATRKNQAIGIIKLIMYTPLNLSKIE